MSERETIKSILMRRDGMSESEADELIKAAAEALLDYLTNGELGLAEEVCCEYFSLEPDYLSELI